MSSLLEWTVAKSNEWFEDCAKSRRTLISGQEVRVALD